MLTINKIVTKEYSVFAFQLLPPKAFFVKNRSTSTIITTTMTKSNPVKKLKASKECTAPIAHSSKLIKPQIPVYIIQYSIAIVLHVCMGYVHEVFVHGQVIEVDLPNAIKGMEAKAPNTTTTKSHRIGRRKEHS